jgi:hypothetical protein
VCRRAYQDHTKIDEFVAYQLLGLFCFFFMNFASKSAEAFETTAVLRFFAEA